MPAPNFSERQKIAKDTLERTPAIIAAHSEQGATKESQFISSQLPSVSHPSSPLSPTTYKIVNFDSFTAARDIIRAIPEAESGVAILNLASDEEPGGGWFYSLSKTQEEALCYSSTLFITLKPSYYPWPNMGPDSIKGVYSPGVVVFKDDLEHGCVDLEEKERAVVAVLTVAAPRYPKLTRNGRSFEREEDLQCLREKIKLVYRMASRNGKHYVVLGAMGCGAYLCPPRLVAQEMKAILLNEEFKHTFRQVVFAVYSTPANGGGNFDIFKDIFKDILSEV